MTLQVEASQTNKYIIIIFVVHLLLVVCSLYVLMQVANYVVALQLPQLSQIVKVSAQSMAADIKRAADSVEDYTTLGSLGMRKQSNSAEALIAYTAAGTVVQNEQLALIAAQKAQLETSPPSPSKNAFA